jgi:hypothetical protein
MHWQADPDEETTDWRAVCGRTARTVRRAGTAQAVSDPYQAWPKVWIPVFTGKTVKNEGIRKKIGGRQFDAISALWVQFIPRAGAAVR